MIPPPLIRHARRNRYEYRVAEQGTTKLMQFITGILLFATSLGFMSIVLWLAIVVSMVAS